MKTHRSLALACALAASAAGVAVVAPGAAEAAPAPYRTLVASPATSPTIAANIEFDANATCSSLGATNSKVTLSGPGFTTPYNLLGNNDTNGITTTHYVAAKTLKQAFASIPAGTASAAGVNRDAPSGRYTVTAVCQDSTGTQVAGQFVGFLTFTPNSTSSDSAYASTVANPATETVVDAITGTYEYGDSVTLAATVSAASGPVGAGTVQFKDNGQPLGTPQAVSSSGRATYTTAALGAGSHSITAVYLHGTAAYEDSDPSAAQTLVIDKKTTAITVTSAGTSEQYAAATFTATVTPAFAGQVTFSINGSTAGTAAVDPSTGVATYSTTSLAPGTYAVSATFAPTDSANIKGASTSTDASHIVTAYAGATTEQTLSTTVAAGSLTISVDGDSTVALSTPVMDVDGEKLTSTGAIDPIVIADTRAGDPGWTASGLVSDFRKGSDKISGFNLGWTPGYSRLSTNQVGFVTGPTVAPALVNAGAVPSDASLGLGAQRVLGRAANDAGNGTAKLTADLLLQIPTELPAGTYAATLTFTVL